MVAPTMIAIFLLLLRALVVLEGVGEVVEDGVGVGVVALETAVVGDEVGAVVGVGVGVTAAEERGM